MNKLLKNIALIGLFSITLAHISCGSSSKPTASSSNLNTTKMDTITFGAGCFWCVEAVYQRLKGVHSVTSGYMGGKLKNPTYREVCSGLTGHAEVCQITYDPQVISFQTLLEVFWQTHDPTTLNRQGADVGTQYRSAIFAHSDEQLRLAQEWKSNLNAKQVFPNPIVTQIVEASDFYPAEDYHQDYYQLNGTEPYCQIVIKPKMDKFLKVFKDKLN
ncbi:MAG: Peptide-methionine (S)-S-oxide reductase [Bacteroidota bacterium]|jgi:peptide-methionine (S)-S-oxide reductase